MPDYRLSKAAESDIRGIIRYTLRGWGPAQARKYLAELEERFQQLAQHPGMGRACDFIASGLHRHEQGRHVIFYREQSGGVRIVRVLHRQMIPDRGRFQL